MPYAIKGQIDGLKPLFDRLDGLAAKVRRKILRDAISEGSKIITKAAKAGAPVQTRLLRNSLGRKIKTYRNSGIVVAIIGPRVGFRKEVLRGKRRVLSNPTKYAHLVELGTKRMSARPFLRPAFARNSAAIMRAMAGIIEKGAEQAAGGK